MILLDRAVTHVGDILQKALELKGTERVLVVFDVQTRLSRLLAEAYKLAIPRATFIQFDAVTPPEIFAAFDALKAKDLVVLIQSNSFRLDEFRIRIELFKRKLKVIEHVHLERMDEAQDGLYVESLAYDPTYYRGLGHALQAKLDATKEVVVECEGTKLVYASEMEPAKPNLGDYAGMKNIGGTFPIGEVFTEPKDLTAVNGDALVFGYAGEDFYVRLVTPFRIVIEQGMLSAPDAPAEFQAILAKIRETDGDVLVREFGLGLNPAFGKDRLVNDITAFERQKGLHFSLGGKHTVYTKPGINKKHARFHVDIFIDATRILADGKALYEGGEFVA